jgi:hypothetical protein
MSRRHRRGSSACMMSKMREGEEVGTSATQVEMRRWKGKGKARHDTRLGGSPKNLLVYDSRDTSSGAFSRALCRNRNRRRHTFDSNSETDSTILSIPTSRPVRIRSWVVRNRIGIWNVNVIWLRSIDQPLDGDEDDDDLPVPPPARTKTRRTSLSRVPAVYNVGADTFLNGRPRT